jgi:hypothetical protein
MPSPEESSIPVEYLTTARLGEKGQITLPKAYRDTVALEVGAPITVLQLGTDFSVCLFQPVSMQSSYFYPMKVLVIPGLQDRQNASNASD